MITESLPVPVFGRDGEPCPACGAPLAGDQRYCLHCGARRPEARLQFLDVLDADVRARSAAPHGFAPPVVTAALPPQPPRGVNARLQANSGALALGALMLLALLVGLLVGHWVTGAGTPAASAPPAPQVIRVEGGAAAPAATATDAAGGAAPAATKTSKAGKGAKAGARAKPPKDAVSVTSVAGDKKALDKAVKKGKPISTGTGAPPAKDNKPAGGGSGFETIG